MNNFSLTDFPSLSNTTRDFVSGSQNLFSVLEAKHPFRNIETAISLKKNFEHRSTLVSSLTKQYEPLWNGTENDAIVKNNILALGQDNAYTVTTGQQLHLFIGPAFVMYKIMAVIAKAKELSELYPGKKFIPVYWMASEDHDFEEIKSTHLFGKNYDWPSTQKGACGRFKTNEVKLIIDQIKETVNLSPENLEILDFFDRTYQTQKSLSAATAATIHHFFGDRGVVCIDGDDLNLKKIIAPMIKKDIIERSNKTIFDNTGKKMSELGYHLQLGVRDVNFFYLTEQSRSRISFENGSYRILETEQTFSGEEMLQLIDNHPENFSPNAMMRPLYQESILPNILYIGGNAEVNYWIQLSEVMTSNGVHPPALMLRPSVWIIPSKVSERITKSGLNELQLMLSKDKSEIINGQGNKITKLEQEKEDFDAFRNKLQSLAAQNNSSLLKALVEAGKQYEKLIKDLEKQIVDEQLKKHENELDKLIQIRDSNLNLSKIQERVTSSLEMLIKYGYRVANIPSEGSFAKSDGIFINL